MQVILTDREFKQAMTCWLTSQGFNVAKYDLDVKITVGRGDNAGTKAEITLTDIVDTPIANVPESLIQLAAEVFTSIPVEETIEVSPAGSGTARPFFNTEE